MTIEVMPEVHNRLDDRVFIVFGGATGSGEALSRRLVEVGATVVIADIDEAAGHRVADDIGLQCRYRRVDILDEDDHVTSVEASLARYGCLDGLFYCVDAGDYVAGAEREVSDSAIHASIDRAHLRLTALLPSTFGEVCVGLRGVRLVMSEVEEDASVLATLINSIR